MTSIFDLQNIKKLVDDNKPRAILLVDTNIVMNNPIITKWETDLIEPIYIFPQVILSELEYLKDKAKKNDAETPEKSKEAIRRFGSFADTGNIDKGIHTNNVGWIISIIEPDSSLINPALAEKETIKKAFGESDAKMIILFFEVSKCFKHLPVILLTNDKNLSNLAKVQGFLTHEVPEFPLQLDKWLANKELQQPIDFDQVLRDINKEAKTYTWTVEATMLSKRYDSEHIEIDGMFAKLSKMAPPEMLADEPDAPSLEVSGETETRPQISDLRKYRTYGDSNEDELQYPNWYQYKENKQDIESGIRKGFIVIEGTGRIIRPEKHDIGFTWKTYYKPLISPVMANGTITELQDLIGRRLRGDTYFINTIINLLGSEQVVSNRFISLLEYEIDSYFDAVIVIPGCKPILRMYSAESPLSIAEWATGLPDKYWTKESLKPDALIEHIINYINKSTKDERRRLLSSIIFTWEVGQKISFQIQKAIRYFDGTVEYLIND